MSDTVSGTALERRAPAVSLAPTSAMDDREFGQLWRTAKALAESHMFKDAQQATQAFAKILIGRDLGLSPTQALLSIDLVRGNIQLRGVLLASFVRKSGTYNYKTVKHTHDECTLLMLGYPQDEQEEGLVRTAGKWWEVLGESSFTIADAQAAKLVKADSAWTTHPRNMVFWRAMSNGVKMHAPDLLGGVPIYTEADTFEGSATEITQEMEGDGAVRGLALPTAVEAVLARASALGHAGLSDRATAEMQLDGQPAARVEEWCAQATKELNALAAGKEAPEPAPVGDGDDPQQVAEQEAAAHDDGPEAMVAAAVEAMRREAARLNEEADALLEAGDQEGADAKRDEAFQLATEADAADGKHGEQESLL